MFKQGSHRLSRLRFRRSSSRTRSSASVVIWTAPNRQLCSPVRKAGAVSDADRCCSLRPHVRTLAICRSAGIIRFLTRRLLAQRGSRMRIRMTMFWRHEGRDVCPKSDTDAKHVRLHTGDPTGRVDVFQSFIMYSVGADSLAR